MKTLRIIGISLILVALALFSAQCGKGAKGGADDAALLKMLPENASGFVLFDFKKVAELGLFKTMRESMGKEDGDKANEALKTFDQFISKTGFDPEKDLHAGAMAVYGGLETDKPLVAFVANGSFDPEKIISYAKTHNTELKEETLGGVTLYHMAKEGSEEMALCFPAGGVVAMGQTEQLKKTLDVIQGKGRSIMDNSALMQHKKKTTAGALLSAVFLIPEKARAMQEKMQPPFEFDLSKAVAVTAELFYGSDTWSGALVMISDNPEGNKKNASTLNMLKSMGVVLGPEVAEVLNGLSFNPGDKQLEIKFSITKTQLEKLGKKAKETLPGMSEGTPAEPSME